MEEFDYEREEQLKEAGQKRANAWANVCSAFKMFFFGMMIVYMWGLGDGLKEADSLSWETITQTTNLMNLLMAISSVVLWRTALNAESSLMFTPWTAPAHVLHFIPMTAIYLFLTVAFYLYYLVSVQYIDAAIFTEFWCTASLIVSFFLFGALSVKMSNRVRYEIAATPEMRAIFPDGDKFPASESSAFGCIAWVVHIVFMVYFCCACANLY